MGLRSSKVLNTDELTSVCDPLDKKLPPLHTKVKPQRRSLFNADGKEARLDIIRSRMKRGRSMRDDFTIPPKASPPERKTDDISDIFEKMSVNYEYSFSSRCDHSLYFMFKRESCLSKKTKTKKETVFAYSSG